MGRTVNEARERAMPTGVSDFKLSDVLSSAGATIGIIIAGTIFLQFLSTKYTDLSGRFRELAAEYRGKAGEEPRHGPLRSQIQSYRRRLSLLHWAATLAAVALLFLLGAVVAGALSMMLSSSRHTTAIGAASLVLGLLLNVGAVALELVELMMSRTEIRKEVADLDGDAQRSFA
jgi:CBS domain containing-hemolysin-like protein